MKSYVSPKKKKNLILHFTWQMWQTTPKKEKEKKKGKRVGSKILEQETSTIEDKKD